MNIREILISCFCLLVLNAGGQEQIYFNERIDHFNNYDYSRNIIGLDDGYMVFGITFDTIYNYFIQYTFSKLTLEGEVEWVKTYGDTINDYLEGQPGSIIKYSNDKYFTCGYKSQWVGQEVSYCGYLRCLDAVFDTLWTQSYCQDNLPYDTTYVLHQMKKCNDGGLVFAGVFVTKYDYSKIWLLKTDSLGNKQWERFFSDGTQTHQGHSVIQTTDGGFAIGGYKYYAGNSNSGDPLIIKTDSLGNEEWTLNPGGPYDDNKVMLSLSQEGYIIAATNCATEPHGDNRDAKNQILKILNDGSIFYNRKYGESKYDNYLLQVRVKENGDIVCTGSYRSFDPTKTGWVLYTDSNGNQKWYREYINLSGDNSSNSLRDIIITNDNGFLACGQVEPAVPDTGNPDIWVLKLDSLGYDTSNVGIIETEVGEPLQLHIYPDPVTGEFTLNFGEPSNTGLTLSIYNTQGIKVEEIKISKGEKTITLDASEWSPCLYVAIAKEQGRIIGKRKFVVR